MMLLLVGDTHGTTSWMTRVLSYAETEQCQVIVQLGDFGYWEHTPDGTRFLRVVEKLLAKTDRRLYWIDGNHENHTMLRAKYGPANNKPVDEHGFWQIRPHIFYIPRGSRWTWDGVSFLGVGGAYSVDKDPRPEWGWTGRVPGVSWWPEETITDHEVNLASSWGPTDVMLTHDVPIGIDVPCLRSKDKDMFPDAVANRVQLRRIVDVARPKLLVHGHMHDRYTSHLELDDGHVVQVEGLDCEYHHGNMVSVDTEVLR